MVLIVPRQIALNNVNAYIEREGGEPLSEAQFIRVGQVVDYHACGRVLEQAIKDFYLARKDRRIRKWDTHTPSDKHEMAL
jgi:hypothetical protein